MLIRQTDKHEGCLVVLAERNRPLLCFDPGLSQLVESLSVRLCGGGKAEVGQHSEPNRQKVHSQRRETGNCRAVSLTSAQLRNYVRRQKTAGDTNIM
jgi:hypothetical protein